MDKKIEIIAHRGFSSQAPENTMSAFEKALKLGVDMVEFDVHLTEDDQIVVLHDYSLERTTNGDGKVYTKSASYIRSLDAGSWFSDGFGQERVPFLSDVLDWSNGKVKLLIEVKGSLRLYSNLSKVLTDLIKEFKAEDWCIIQSFDKNFLEDIHQLSAGLTHHMLLDENEFIPETCETFIQAINPNYRYIDYKWIQRLHLKNLKVFPYTVNLSEDMQVMIETGVDGIITDYPDILKQLLNDS